MSLALDFTQQVVNVNWDLAEDFLIGGRSLLASSTDGQTLTVVSPPSGNELTAAAYYGGVWVVADTGLTIYRSENPESFSWASAWGGNGNYVLLAAGKPKDEEDGIFIAAITDLSGDTPKIDVMRSHDKGQTWSAVTSFSNTRAMGLDFVDEKFFLSGAKNDQGAKGGCYLTSSPTPGFLASSKSGITWNTVAIGTPVSLTVGDLPTVYACPAVLGVAYSPEIKKYIAVHQAPFTWIDESDIENLTSYIAFSSSTNGTTWSAGSTVSGTTTINILEYPTGQRAITYGGENFAAIGRELRPITGTFTGYIAFGPRVLISASGSGWAAEDIILPNYDEAILGSLDYGAINFSKSAKRFLVGGAGTATLPAVAAILSSENASAWVTVYSKSNASVNFIALGKIPVPKE